ncbi:MAG: hypothetical protein ATN36_03180 [Epulopiscium sp. Nele67-Bin005]|nr:MAG: hypothetical protein ATN36_03180 [Epulopiscium sp. Nele67-Bin005]
MQDNLLFMIKRIHSYCVKHGNTHMEQHDLTMAQAGFLLILSEYDNHQVSLKEIEKRMGTSQPTIAGIACRLEEKELISSFTDENDKRIKIIKSTQKGKDKLVIIHQGLEQVNKKLLEDFTETEKIILTELLLKLYTNIQNP